MARCPIVRPETVRVTLGDDEWLELAKELTAGEYRDMFAAQLKDAQLGDVPTVDMRQLGLSLMLAYVKDWSFVDMKGEPLPITGDWLRKFGKPTYDEVSAVVEAHHNAQEAAVAERKNVPAGATTS